MRPAPSLQVLLQEPWPASRPPRPWSSPAPRCGSARRRASPSGSAGKTLRLSASKVSGSRKKLVTLISRSSEERLDLGRGPPAGAGRSPPAPAGCAAPCGADPPPDRRLPVVPEVDAGEAAQELQHLPEQVFVGSRERPARAAGAGDRYGCRPIRASSRAMASGGRTKSTQPLLSALCGMPEYLADTASWAKVMPPSALISSSPSVPSEPLPDRITPMAPAPRSAASDWRKRSIGRFRPCDAPRGSRWRTPSATVSVVSGGMM